MRKTLGGPPCSHPAGVEGRRSPPPLGGRAGLGADRPLGHARRRPRGRVASPAAAGRRCARFFLLLCVCVVAIVVGRPGRHAPAVTARGACQLPIMATAPDALRTLIGNSCWMGASETLPGGRWTYCHDSTWPGMLRNSCMTEMTRVRSSRKRTTFGVRAAWYEG